MKYQTFQGRCILVGETSVHLQKLIPDYYVLDMEETMNIHHIQKVFCNCEKILKVTPISTQWSVVSAIDYYEENGFFENSYNVEVVYL